MVNQQAQLKCQIGLLSLFLLATAGVITIWSIDIVNYHAFLPEVVYKFYSSTCTVYTDITYEQDYKLQCNVVNFNTSNENNQDDYPTCYYIKTDNWADSVYGSYLCYENTICPQNTCDYTQSKSTYNEAICNSKMRSYFSYDDSSRETNCMCNEVRMSENANYTLCVMTVTEIPVYKTVIITTSKNNTYEWYSLSNIITGTYTCYDDGNINNLIIDNTVTSEYDGYYQCEKTNYEDKIYSIGTACVIFVIGLVGFVMLIVKLCKSNRNKDYEQVAN